MSGVSNLLASLGHTGRGRVVLGHALNAQTRMKTDKQKCHHVLSIFTTLHRAAFTATQGRVWPVGHGLETPEFRGFHCSAYLVVYKEGWRFHNWEDSHADNSLVWKLKSINYLQNSHYLRNIDYSHLPKTWKIWVVLIEVCVNLLRWNHLSYLGIPAYVWVFPIIYREEISSGVKPYFSLIASLNCYPFLDGAYPLDSYT